MGERSGDSCCGMRKSRRRGSWEALGSPGCEATCEAVRSGAAPAPCALSAALVSERDPKARRCSVPGAALGTRSAGGAQRGGGGLLGAPCPPSGLLRGACEPLSPTAACGAAAGSGSPFPGLIAASWRSAVRRARPSPSPPCARCGCALISRKAALCSPVPAAPRARSSREDGKRSQCSPDEAAFGGGAAAGGCGLGWTPVWGRTVPRGSAVDAAASRGRCAVGSHRVSPERGRGAVCVRSPSRLGALW